MNEVTHKVLYMTPNHWGAGPTVKEAWQNNPGRNKGRGPFQKHYIVYVLVPPEGEELDFRISGLDGGVWCNGKIITLDSKFN